MNKNVIFWFCMLGIIFLSACSPKYVCPDGSQRNDPSQCPKQVECKYHYDCDPNGRLRCLANHCVSISDYNEAMGIEEGGGVRVVECNALTPCEQGYICSELGCVKTQTSVRNY